ncbi:MAG: hypothetical protein ACYTBJ_02330 [Planctomycetota bacterium]|jgi:hypothetical protein
MSQTIDFAIGKPPSYLGSSQALGDLFRLTLTGTGNPNADDRFGWDVDELASYTAFDWADGDGTTPATGPTLTATGTLTSGVLTPWTRCEGSQVTATKFDSGGYYTSTAVDPTNVTDDWVHIYLSRHAGQGATEFIAATRATAGSLGLWHYYTTTGGNRARVAIDGDTADVFPIADDVLGGWNLIVSRGDKSGNHYLYVNGVLEDTDDITGVGDIRGGNGLGIGCLPTGSSAAMVDVVRVLFYYGAGIADIVTQAWVDRLTATVFGYQNQTGSGNCTFRGDGARSFVQCDTGGVHVLGNHTCPSGNTGGMEPLDGGTNKVYKNYAYATGDDALWSTDVGMTTSVVDDGSKLSTVDCRDIGPNVIRMRSTGADRYTVLGDTTGNTNKHWLSGRFRVIAGAPQLVLWDGATSTLAMTLTATDYSVTFTTVTPANANQKWGLRMVSGSEVYAVLGQLYEGVVPAPEIPNVADAATATLAEATLQFPSTLAQADNAGTWEITLEPHEWNSGDLGSLKQIIRMSTTSTHTFDIDDSVSPAKLQIRDGTSTASATISEVSETPVRCMTSWGALLVAQQEGQTLDTAPYDGALLGTGTLQIKGTGMRCLSNIILHADYHANIGLI